MTTGGIETATVARPQVTRPRPIRKYRRVRIAFALLVLIGITTPHATSAPADEVVIEQASPLFGESILDDPPVLMLLGAAMLGFAAYLRRNEGGGRLHD